MNLVELLMSGSEQMGIALEEKKALQLIQYKNILLEWNQKMNLTAIEEEKEVVIKHFLDSLSCVKTKYLSEKGKLIDIGTGAGFPGIPLKVYYPQLELTLLDSLNKRINFLKAVCDQLDLREVNFLHGRAEDYGQDKMHREGYDYAVARAVAGLNVLVEYCLPFVKVGGYFICQKGPHLSEELPEAQKSIKILGGEVADQYTVQLPFSEISHSILVIYKKKETPTKYPRKAGKPSKEPIK